MDLSLVAKTFDFLRISPPSKLILLEAQTLSSSHVPPFPPDMPVLIVDIESRDLALHIKSVLLTTYSAEHIVHVVENGNTKEERLNDFEFSDSSCIYIPPLGGGTS